ncbi:MAG: hypothetical protein WKF96_14975 [Solirubrobacteraceae bacterium]
MKPSGGIFLLGDDGQLVQLSEQRYDSEDLLQALVERHPELLAGELIDPDVPRQWLLISREIPFAGDDGHVGRIDHVLIDQDGVPTFVEVKRSTDTRIRREVVGQLLEYVANAVVFWDAADMRRRLADTAGGEELADESVRAFIGDADPEAWWQQVQTNLRARKVRLLFVADVIPASLQRIVEFLNETMDPPEVLAIEIRQYTGGEPPRTSLVPRVFGQTAAASAKRGVNERGEPWTEERWWAALAKRSPEAADAARPIVDWAKQRMSDLWMGSGKLDGSLTPVVYMADDRQFFPFILWTYGTVEIQFTALSRRPPFDQLQLRRELRDRLAALAAISIPDEKLDKRPGIPMITLRDPSALQHFIQTMEWALERLDAEPS